MSSIVLKCKSSFLPLTPHHGSWHAACWPETQRCQLSLQPHPAHAAVYGTCSSEYWPALPTGINVTQDTILYHHKCEPGRTFKPQLTIYKGKKFLMNTEDKTQMRDNFSSPHLQPPQQISCRLWLSAAAYQPDPADAQYSCGLPQSG